ncbi:UDP-3-0-acyl N-acetylglucosamine deacetylase [Saccharophagus degradans]|uniref:PilZ domain-containing protein n=2 Tax=Saccharophagus degradans TaxID=86304 RepID=Q21MJ6_SACD2|nr:UDP-3-0-acyl N-acetylglucosamine deacetylase [Saccharophagus degradans]ABD80083.1 hypothetical protein Sde_0821 [Saccharophagus degradans 2-40]MBU2984779.1 hypothetical protein [Saccharophagus degradans]MDO6423177.1 hypothetical protein [Saccharophagus degradans]MDO6607299.1 hypothetical protein [Saccharophagus degradans]WGO97735.1 hypothetical protein QFX18_17130 [Saccharophagus degradans]
MINKEQNSRRLDRVGVQQEVVVRDSLTGQKLGQLANIHCEGFMLFGDENVQENHIYQLHLELSQPINNVSNLSIGAECLWLNASGDNSQCWAGFHIIDISDSDKTVVNLIGNDLSS